MDPMTMQELQLYVGIVALSNLLLGLAMIFRTDDIVRVIKKKFDMEEFEHLPLGWRSVVGALLNIAGLYLAFVTGISGAFIMWAAHRAGLL